LHRCRILFNHVQHHRTLIDTTLFF